MQFNFKGSCIDGAHNALITLHDCLFLFLCILYFHVHYQLGDLFIYLEDMSIQSNSHCHQSIAVYIYSLRISHNLVVDHAPSYTLKNKGASKGFFTAMP